jgi:hypothetical protein
MVRRRDAALVLFISMLLVKKDPGFDPTVF